MQSYFCCVTNVQTTWDADYITLHSDYITLHSVWWRWIRNMFREAEAAGNSSLIWLVLCLHKRWEELDTACWHTPFFWDKSRLIMPLQRTCKSIKDCTEYSATLFFFFFVFKFTSSGSKRKKWSKGRRAIDRINLNNCGKQRGIVFQHRFALTGWQLQLDS